MKELIVDEKYNGKKLNTILLNTFNGLTLNTLYKALRKKDIRINDTRVSENVTLHAGDHIKVYICDEQLEKNNSQMESKASFSIVYEDDYICVVNKPAGIEVVGENSLTNVLLKYYQDKYEMCSSNKNDCIDSSSEKRLVFIAPCHRLDRNTNGLVLFAKDETALQILLDKFKNHEIEKHYLAAVYGIPTKKQDTLTAYLFKDAKKSLVYISDTPKKGYEKIITSYRVIGENRRENTSILDVNLHTGKTHQIRAHLAYIGYPILGDGKYGNNAINKQFGYKVQQLTSFSLSFHFKTDSGILNYLNQKSIYLK